MAQHAPADPRNDAPADAARPGELNRPSMDMISSKLCDSLPLKSGIEILFLQNLAAYGGPGI
jgi:hypothetical protein